MKLDAEAAKSVPTAPTFTRASLERSTDLPQPGSRRTPSRLDARSILPLQRSAGNAAVAGVLGGLAPRSLVRRDISLQRCPGGCPPGACTDHAPQQRENDLPAVQTLA